MEEKSGDFAVAPGEGAWIEIFLPPGQIPIQIVAPGEGAWIEIPQRTPGILSLYCRSQ